MQEVATIGQDLSREKVELIKQTVAKGATDLELELFLHACKRTGLDPLMKQIYAIKRWNSADKKEVLSFQTGIDGYRLIADRTGRYAGSDEPSYMIAEDGFPDVASVTVTKLVDGMPCKFAASARWDEYVQKTKEGDMTSMWKKMPFLMLGKCAEALALRKAFPAELSGIYTHEEMMQADEPAKPTVMDAKRTAQAKIQELREQPQIPDGMMLTMKPSELARRSQEEANKPQGDGSIAPGTGRANQSEARASQQEGDAPAAPSDDPAEPYRARLRTCHDEKACNELYATTPEELKQDVHGAYFDKLKELSKRKSK